jgi:hypothetical protein
VRKLLLKRKTNSLCKGASGIGHDSAGGNLGPLV